jgi:hypothetical protein
MVSTEDENTAHPNWPTGPYGDASELVLTGEKTEKENKKHHKHAWPNPADDEPDQAAHPNYPIGPYGHIHKDPYPVPPPKPKPVPQDGSAYLKTYLNTAQTSDPASIAQKRSKWPDPADEDPEPQAHPDFPTGPYGHAYQNSVAQLNGPKPLQKKSDPNCNSADGCLTDTVDPFTKKSDPGYPINYKVPDYGIDHDIKVSQENLKNTEETLGHKLQVPKEEAKKALV